MVVAISGNHDVGTLRDGARRIREPMMKFTRIFPPMKPRAHKAASSGQLFGADKIGLDSAEV